MDLEAFLGSLPIFQELDDEELADLASISEAYQYPAGAIIAYQRDVADSLIIVAEGRLSANRVTESGDVEHVRHFLPGDSFDDAWLFTPDTYPATVKTAAASRIVIIKAADFFRFMERNPGVLLRMGLSETAMEESGRSRLALRRRRYAAVELLPNELVEFEARRNRWMFFLRIRGIYEAVLPALGILLAPLLCSWALQNWFNTANWGLLALIVPLLPALLCALVLFFFMLDWLNDFFLITNKHVVHYEFSLQSFRTSIHKVPIDRVQSVEIVKPNLFANLMNVGTARITTAAQAGILYFDFITNPIRVRETLNAVRQRVKALDAGLAQASMRGSVESHFQVRPLQEKIEATLPEDEEYVAEEEEEEISPVTNFRSKLASAFNYRVVEGVAVTYRKHVLVLLGKVWWQLLAILVLGFLVIYLRQVMVLAVIASLAFVVILFWFIWRLEDWRNDIYQVTDRVVLDVDRKPFGFGESRKQAELSNIQNVNASRTGILPTIFDFGTVEVETAGSEANITFESVAHPNRIQAELFQRRDMVRQQKRRQEEEQRRKEYAVLLDVYQQAREQDRIPRRTPPSET